MPPPQQQHSPSNIQTTLAKRGETIHYRIEDREIRARLDTPLVRAVLDMGFERKVVINAIAKRLSQHNTDFPNVQALLDAVFEEKGRQLEPEENSGTNEVEKTTVYQPILNTKRQLQSEPTASAQFHSLPPTLSSTSGSNATTTSPMVSLPLNPLPTTSNGQRNDTNNNSINPKNGNHHKHNRKKPKQKQNKDTNAPKPATPPLSSTSTRDSKMNTKTKTLEEENRQLKDQRMCKVCMDAEANILFLPCGHLVCCAECAPSLRNCAVCRSLIRGTVRTYLS